jgi:hypothetical protein
MSGHSVTGEGFPVGPPVRAKDDEPDPWPPKRPWEPRGEPEPEGEPPPEPERER